MSKLVQFLSDAGSVSTVVPAITRQAFVIVVGIRAARMFVNVRDCQEPPLLLSNPNEKSDASYIYIYIYW